MMSPRPQELIASFLDRRATTQDVVELDGLLRSSPDVLTAFVECAQLDQALAGRFRDHREREAVRQLVDRLGPPANPAAADASAPAPPGAPTGDSPHLQPAAAQSPVLGFLGRACGDAADRPTGWTPLLGSLGKLSTGFFTPKVIVLSVATLLGGYFCTLALSVILGRYQNAEAPVGQAPQAGTSYATLSHAVDSRWSDKAPQQLGERLPLDEVVLEEGFVELTLDEGVHVVIEGPTQFQVLGANALLLKQGRLVASVPSMAIGFTVTTPTAEVIDLGTEFGVTVGENAETDVIVFRGKVEVKPQTGATSTKAYQPATVAKSGSVRLRAGESRRVTRAGITSIAAAEASGARLVRTIPRSRTTQAVPTGPAREIEVRNFSFEEDSLDELGTTLRVINSWQGTDGVWGAYNPNQLQFPGAVDSGPDSDQLAEPADGKQVAFINSGSIYQNVGRLEANTQYTLVVALGRRLDGVAGGQPTIQLVNGTDATGVVLASIDPNPPEPGIFKDVSITFITGPSVSGDLTIVMGSTAVQMVVDNVRLVAAPLCESGDTPAPKE